jgi:hypothetical protein
MYKGLSAKVIEGRNHYVATTIDAKFLESFKDAERHDPVAHKNSVGALSHAGELSAQAMS